MENTPKQKSWAAQTQEEKAWATGNRTLSDAEFIKGGAKYIPDSNGEPVLNVTEEQKLRTEVEMERDSPESQKLLSLFNKIRSSNSFRDMFHDGRNASTGKGRSIYKEAFSLGHHETLISLQSNDPSEYSRGGLPYIGITRKYMTENTEYSDGYQHNDETTRCYSLQEFYDNLKPEEKGNGEALGKELESYLED